MGGADEAVEARSATAGRVAAHCQRELPGHRLSERSARQGNRRGVRHARGRRGERPERMVPRSTSGAETEAREEARSEAEGNAPAQARGRDPLTWRIA